MGIDAEHRDVVIGSKPAPIEHVAIVGAGPAGLFAAEIIARAGYRVTIYERMPSPARKFLLAGRGGLNLTHSEPLDTFLSRYGDRAHEVRAAVAAFPPSDLIAWVNDLGVETFAGTSGRVFPKAMKASPLLRAWLRRLGDLGVEIKTRHVWTGFDGDQGLLFDHAGDLVAIEPSAGLLALGGASWPKLGADGSWSRVFDAAGIPVVPLMPANCGVEIAWSPTFRDRFAGTPLKRIALTIGDATHKGEAIVTRTGLEGGAVYPLVPAIRAALARGPVRLHVDLKPDHSHAELIRRLANPRGGDTLSNVLRKAAKLDQVAVGVLRELALPSDAEGIASRIKSVPLDIAGLTSLDRAISTAGGVPWSAMDDRLMLRRRAGTFVAGEMIDWEAPTGGFLLQATFATAAKAANGILNWLSREH